MQKRYHDEECSREKKERNLYRHCAKRSETEETHVKCVGGAHFFRIDFSNHIVNAKKIIIQNERYWVTICACAQMQKGTEYTQTSTAHLNRSNIKKEIHTQTQRNRNLYQSLLNFSIVLISCSHLLLFKHRWGAYCTSNMGSVE